MNIYDVIIIGGGPAGLSASIYALRAGLSVIIFEEAACGGQMLSAHDIENYPGFQSVTGTALADAMLNQAAALGAVVIYQSVKSVTKENEFFSVFTDSEIYHCKAVIAASGTRRRKLQIPQEDDFVGRGISYCALCDGRFFRNRDVAVVGGGNTAFSDALYLSNLCNSVKVIHRTNSFRADHVILQQVMETKNIQLLPEMRINRLIGSEKLTSLELVSTSSVQLSSQFILDVDGLFIAVGSEPNTAYLEQLPALTRDKSGCIITDMSCCSSLQGLYAVGDIRSGSIRQIVTATADGAVAGAHAAEYIIAKI